MSFKSSLFAVLLATSSLAQAGVVYNEAIQGDAPSTVGPSMIGAVVTLAPGSNDILGTYRGSPNDFDDYVFTVNPGMTITAIRFEILGSVLSGVYNADLYQSMTLVSSFSITSLQANTPINAFNMPLTAGTYRIDHRTVPTTTSANYRWTIQLDDPNQVPEPATLGLLGIALAGMGVARRRAGKAKG